MPSPIFIYFWNTDALMEIETQLNNPNDRFSSINLGTWSSTSDVDEFFSRFNHDNNYCDGDTKLRLGDYVTIQDGTYNVVWMIAGFDMEHNQTAADGTVYDNGYGICMIPKIHVTPAKWNNSESVSGGYKSSNVHTSTLPTIVNSLKNVLEDHIVNRNVLLSSNVDSSNNYYSKAYTWTTAYATLMSAGQLTGTFASHRNKYDDGEANYKLPLFNYVTDYKIAVRFWLRGVFGYNGASYYACNVDNKGTITGYIVNGTAVSVRPLIYLR